MQIASDWIPLKQALYGPAGLFPRLRRRDVLALVTPIERSSCATGLTHYFLTPADLARLKVAADQG